MNDLLFLVQTWNELVDLFHAEGMDAVRARHERNAEETQTTGRAIASASSDTGSEVDWEALGVRRRAAQLCQAATMRFLARLKANQMVWKLEPPEPDNPELRDLLDWRAPIFKPRLAEFDAFVEGLRWWRRCAETVAEAPSKGEGLHRVRVLLDETKKEAQATLQHARRRIAEAEAPPQPDTFNWEEPPQTEEEQIARLEHIWARWKRIAPDVEYAYAGGDSLAFRISLIERFISFVHQSDQLYPKDWDFRIAISPFPSNWCINPPHEKSARGRPREFNSEDSRRWHDELLEHGGKTKTEIINKIIARHKEKTGFAPSMSLIYRHLRDN